MEKYFDKKGMILDRCHETSTSHELKKAWQKRGDQMPKIYIQRGAVNLIKFEKENAKALLKEWGMTGEQRVGMWF